MDALMEEYSAPPSVEEILEMFSSKDLPAAPDEGRASTSTLSSHRKTHSGSLPATDAIR